MRQTPSTFPVLALAAALLATACSDGGSDLVGTWRAVADTSGPQPTVLYEFRPDHGMTLHMLTQNASAEGRWIRGQGDEVRIEFADDSYFAGRTVDGRLLASDSLMLEINNTERIFVPRDTTASR